MEIKVEKIDPNRDDANGSNTKVTIRGLANNSKLKPIVVHQIKGLKLGKGQNTIRFIQGAMIADVTPGDQNTTTVKLDYSDYQHAATVNLGDAAIHVSADSLVRTGGNDPTWGATSYVLTDETFERRNWHNELQHELFHRWRGDATSRGESSKLAFESDQERIAVAG